MYNELVFILHALLVGIGVLVATYWGQSALVAYIILQAILANLFITKQTTLFGLNATCSDAFVIGAVLGLNLLQEYYGNKSASSAIWTSFGLLVFYTCAAQIQLLYIPAAVDTMHDFFAALLSPMPRLTVASIIVYLIVQHLDAWLYGVLKRHWHTRDLVLRNYASIAITQLADTILFSFLALYGIVDNIFHIVLISYTIKVCAILMITPLIAFSQRVIPKS